jgi:hypothetical protein
MYKFSHGRINDLRIDTPNHGVLDQKAVKNLQEGSNYTAGGLMYRKAGNMIAVYACVGNSLANNEYVDYYFN